MESLIHTAFVTVSIGTLRAMFGAVFTEEWKAWTPHLAQMLMRGAVRLLPSEARERYLEEWTADLDDIPGLLARILFACDFYRASVLMSWQSRRAEGREVAAADAAALKVISHSSRDLTRVSLAPGSHLRVLVVDNNKVIADTLAIILRQVGYDGRAAFSGEEAVAVAYEFQPHVLISDVIMGRMTGIEVAVELESILPDCQTLLFAGQAATRDLLDEAARNGHVQYSRETGSSRRFLGATQDGRSRDVGSSRRRFVRTGTRQELGKASDAANSFVGRFNHDHFHW